MYSSPWWKCGNEKPIIIFCIPHTLSKWKKLLTAREGSTITHIWGEEISPILTLITDHKPLTAIFGAKKVIPTLAAARLQRWALLLSAYNYEIQYKSTDAHSNADGLSRLPLPTLGSDKGGEGIHIFNVSQLQYLPVTCKNVRQATKNDPCVSKVLPSHIPSDLKPFYNRKDQIFQSNPTGEFE